MLNNNYKEDGEFYDNDGFNLAAVLLFGKDETVRSYLPEYKTDSIYRVDNLDRYDDREYVRTNLIDSFDRLVDFVCRHTDDKFFLDGTQRISVRGIIAREIVGNLLMHCEYSSAFPAKLIIENIEFLPKMQIKPTTMEELMLTVLPRIEKSDYRKLFQQYRQS